jgi:hypothetical protein
MASDAFRPPAGTALDAERASPPVDRPHLLRYTLGERRVERQVLALFCGAVRLACLHELETALHEAETYIRSLP